MDEYVEKAAKKSKEQRIQELEEKYNMGEILQDDVTKLYTALTKDERNRVAYFLLSKELVEAQETDIPEFYVQNYEVKIDHIKNFASIETYAFEKQLNDIKDKVGSIILSGRDWQKTQ